MDPSSFDRLSRLLARAATRRAAIGAVVAALTGAATVTGADADTAQCVAGGKSCRRNSQCCSGTCRLVGGSGVRRVCDCDAGTARCDGACVSIDTPERCGSCNVSCKPGEECCGGRCRAVKTDENHCGACGVKCAAGETCCKGVCVDLETSKTNCGACGKRCAGSNICCDGACLAGGTDENNCGACGNVCATGETCCGGTCVDLASNDSHCGRCNKRCRADLMCKAGVCACPVGVKCGGVCTDLDTSDEHCGACNSPCTDGLTCSGGECLCGEVECGEGTTCVAGVCRCNGSPCRGSCCNDICVDTKTDENNCGACGAACPSGQPCVQGACLLTACTPPATYSSGTCNPAAQPECYVLSDGTEVVGYLSGQSIYTCHGAGTVSPGCTAYPNNPDCIVLRNSVLGTEYYVNGRCSNISECTP
jgi:hypothetical protein